MTITATPTAGPTTAVPAAATTMITSPAAMAPPVGIRIVLVLVAMVVMMTRMRTAPVLGAMVARGGTVTVLVLAAMDGVRMIARVMEITTKIAGRRKNRCNWSLVLDSRN